MVSRNNFQKKQQQVADRTPHYGLRKLGVGVVSVLLSTSLYLGASNTVKAATNNNEGNNNSDSESEIELGKTPVASATEKLTAAPQTEKVSAPAPAPAATKATAPKADPTPAQNDATKPNKQTPAAPTNDRTKEETEPAKVHTDSAKDVTPLISKVKAKRNDTATGALISVRVYDDTDDQFLSKTLIDNRASNSDHTLWFEDGNANDQVPTNTRNEIANFLQNNVYSKGFVQEGGYNVPVRFDVDPTKNIITVHVAHAAQEITGDTDKNTLPPVVHPTDIDDLTLTVHVDYTFKNVDPTSFTGTIPANAHQTIILKGKTYVDLVNGNRAASKIDANGHRIVDPTKRGTIEWTSGQTEAVTFPKEKGYTPDHVETENPIRISVDNNAPGFIGLATGPEIIINPKSTVTYATRVIEYRPDEQQIDYRVIDDTTGTTLVPTTRMTSGRSNEEVNPSAAPVVRKIVADYSRRGYVLRGYDPIPATFDTDDRTNQLVTFHFVHGIGTRAASKDITRTINLHEPNGDVHMTNQDAHLTRTENFDKVTGNVISATAWTTGSWPAYVTPAIAGYTPTIAGLNAQNVDADTSNVTIDIFYNANTPGSTTHTTTPDIPYTPVTPTPTPNTPTPQTPGNKPKTPDIPEKPDTTTPSRPSGNQPKGNKTNNGQQTQTRGKTITTVVSSAGQKAGRRGTYTPRTSRSAVLRATNAIQGEPQLPQTGNSTAALIGLGLAGILSAFGLGVHRRKS